MWQLRLAMLHFVHARMDLSMLGKMLLSVPFVVSKTASASDTRSAWRFRVTFGPRFRAIFPKHMVVFVLMPGCSSFAVLARYFNSSPLIVRSANFVMMVKTAFTVCSRTTGARSVKPVTCYRQQNSRYCIALLGNGPFAERSCQLQSFVIGDP